jgi:hypothetical protein
MFMRCFVTERVPTHTTIREVSNKNYSHILLMGDFNLPDIDWTNYTQQGGSGNKNVQFIDTIRDCYLYQHTLEPTRAR